MTNVVKSLAVNIDRWGIPRRAQLIQLEDGIMSAEQRDQSMKYASVQSELVVCKISTPFPHNNLQPWAKAGVCIRLNW